MSKFDVFIDEYPGSAGWQKFVDVFRPEWNALTDKEKELYRSILGDEGIAIVLTSKMGDRAIDWFVSPLGVLHQRTASEIIKTERQGLTIIKSVLMRMH